MHVALAFEAPGARDDDAYAAQIYATALGGGMSSRLFQELRERRGLCYAIFAQAGAYEDTGLITLYAGTGADQIRELTEVTMDELRRAADGLSRPELERARAQLKAGLLMGLESASARAERMARMLSVWGRVPTIEETIARIDAVTPEALRAFGEALAAGRPAGARAARAGRRRAGPRPSWRGGWRPDRERAELPPQHVRPAIETARLSLRLPEMGDHVAWAQLRRQGERFLRPWEPSWSPDHLSRKAFRNRVYWAWRARDEGRALPLFLVRRGDGRLLGAITLDNIRRGPSQSGQVGYWIGEEFARAGADDRGARRAGRRARLLGARPRAGSRPPACPRTPPRARCSTAAASSTRAWRAATCRSTGAGATTCSTPACAPTGAAAGAAQ